MYFLLFPKNVTREEALLEMWNRQSFNGFLYPYVPNLSDTKDVFKFSNYIDFFCGKRIEVDFSKYPSVNPYRYEYFAGKYMMQKVISKFIHPPRTTLLQDKID